MSFFSSLSSACGDRTTLWGNSTLGTGGIVRVLARLRVRGLELDGSRRLKDLEVCRTLPGGWSTPCSGGREAIIVNVFEEKELTGAA
jgi:hypothetical protein